MGTSNRDVLGEAKTAVEEVLTDVEVRDERNQETSAGVRVPADIGVRTEGQQSVPAGEDPTDAEQVDERATVEVHYIHPLFLIFEL